ncbi:hypothetical protein GE107_21185 [Cohnella sp. CFH 77786]|uniref:hypothetical protein n=1 Tax=Cohnella sp. CFH 77786 TaxID=2662265 RepID=UPI001C61076E|nr:hypothetical protein [Cohnella sp. CFH 77786]MBW5448565.1 hypothetical protein [Cohnella sp. CFH 77786]
MYLFKSKKTLVISIAAVVAALTTSAIAAFGAGEDPAVVQANETHKFIQEEKRQLDETLKKQAPQKYPNGLETENNSSPAPESMNIFDGTLENKDEMEKKINDLPEEKKKAYTRWSERGGIDFGYYKRKIQEIINGVPETKRISLTEVKDIIANKKDFKDQIAELEKLHGTPDYIGGSGLSHIEYWLDEEGKDKVVVLENGLIIYFDKSNKREILNRPELMNQ